MINILLSGVGGQGTVLASKIIAKCAIAHGETAHTAETIGMAQRGGCVVSHVRIGDGAYSPLIPHGCADVIIAFEPAEAVRVIPYLKQGGTVIVNTAPTKPVTDSLSDTAYDAQPMLDYLASTDAEVTAVDGAKIIAACGSAKALNIALLGAAAKTGTIGVTVSELEQVVRTTLKPAFQEANLCALYLGAES